MNLNVNNGVKINLTKDFPFLLSRFWVHEFDLEKDEILIKDEAIEVLIYYFFPTAVIECSNIKNKGGFTRFKLVECLYNTIIRLYNRLDNLDIGIFGIKFKDLVIDDIIFFPKIKRINVSVASIEEIVK